MFLSMFMESKNKKLVKKWKKEHEELVVLGRKVIADYVENNKDRLRKSLKDFTHEAVEHLNSGDIEFYRLMRDPDRNDKRIVEQIQKFNDGFKRVKETLVKFLAKYNQEEIPLDEEFFESFSKIMDVLEQRIDFEEHELYFTLSLS